jgi:hypothetical protein
VLVGLFVEAREVRGDTGVEPADKIVEYFFVVTELIEIVLETVLAIDELPDGPAVVVGEALDVGVQVEVLALVVGLVLHVPHPPLRSLPLVAPQILPVRVRTYTVSVAPELRDVPLVAPAHRAAVGLADPLEQPQRTRLVDVQPDEAEVLGLHQRLQQRRGSHVHLVHGVALVEGRLHEQVVARQVGRHNQDCPNSHQLIINHRPVTMNPQLNLKRHHSSLY